MTDPRFILPKTYQRIGFIFLGVAVISFGAVLYLISSSATISITPASENINQEFVFEVRDGVPAPAVQDNVISGKVLVIGETATSTYPTTGTKSQKSDIVGEVTIHNLYTKNQVLVEKTRLSLPDHLDQVVVRLKKTVTVPAGGQVTVQVYPDDLQNFKDMLPTKFVIPGLSNVLRDKFYAQNEKTLTANGTSVFVVTQPDLTAAQTSLKDQLYKKALGDVTAQLQQQEAAWPKIVSSKVDKITYSANVGDESSTVTASMKLTATVIVFNEDQVILLARNRVTAGLPAGKNLVNLSSKDFTYSVVSYDVAAKTAKVKAKVQGDLTLTDVDNMFDKNKLVGLTVDEVKAYFSQFPEVKSVEVRITPAWFSKLPRVTDKIHLQLAQ